jgi:hypothetical protein
MAPPAMAKKNSKIKEKRRSHMNKVFVKETEGV